ncbi:MAG: dihydropteroate synthase [Pirellulaceae bacterium]|nr:dihydropteroate synthase [Pirellulaceae bacterium]
MQRTLSPGPNDHYYFVTGRLAEPLLRDIVASLAQQFSFAYTIGVMPITVAALMTPRWLRRHLDAPAAATHIIVPGYCETGIDELAQSVEIPVICGPNDCRSLPELFGGQRLADDFGEYDIGIIAEINHAPRLTIDEVVRRANVLRADGADVIDFGCDPVNRCQNIGDYITALVDNGHVVSVDTFDTNEAAQATEYGASLVLSVNSSNRNAAADWGSEVVVIPDSPSDEKSLHETVDFLAKKNVSMRLDPILEPIGAGFANSLQRYMQCRQNYPELAMMMGIGNLTELTDVDSAGVNLLLLSICQELRIHSVLTTQVINWARSSVRECDHARRLTHYAVKHGVPPKRLSDELVMLRDTKLRPYPADALHSLAESIKDNNYRLFAQDDQIHLLAAGVQLSDEDPFRLFDRLMKENVADNIDPGHAFYLGYEMAKASIALVLGKQYEQDRALDWGMLTKQEDLHRIKRSSRHRDNRQSPG